jgi:hypothetical protein
MRNQELFACARRARKPTKTPVSMMFSSGLFAVAQRISKPKRPGNRYNPTTGANLYEFERVLKDFFAPFCTLKSYYFMQSRNRRGIIPDFNKLRERVLKVAKKSISTP